MGQRSSPKAPTAGLLSSQMFTDVVKRRDAAQWET